MRKLPLALNSLAAALCFMVGTQRAQAQALISTTDVPRTISYQGLLTSADGIPVHDGEYTVTLSLYSDPTGTLKVWEDSYTTSVTGGVFNVYLGGGKALLPDATSMNRPLWVGIRLDNSAPMYPLTPLSSSPYALNVPDRAITTGKLADGAVTADKVDMDYIAGIAVNGQPVTAKGSLLNIQGSNDIALTFDDQTNTLRLSRPTPATRGDEEKNASTQGTTSDFWTMQGDGRADGGGVVTPAPGDWIGTSNNVTFETRTNNQTVMRYQPNGTNTPNIAGGNGSNTIDATVIGSVIAGGGSSMYPHTIDSSAVASVISGGSANDVSADYAVVAGGFVNSIYHDADQAVIGGGNNNATSGIASTIGGGYDHLINVGSGYSTISGGYNNETSSLYSTVGGGRDNTASGEASIVGGGRDNTASGTASAVGGGTQNQASGDYATVGGGIQHQATGDYATAGGGAYHIVSGNYATAGGGAGNTASAAYSTVGGGQLNTASGFGSTVPGGQGLEVTQYTQTAVGFFNAPRGTMAAQPTIAARDANSAPLFMVGNGGISPVGATVPSNAFEVSYNGHTTVYGTNGAGPFTPAIYGATYTDNILYAWGDITAAGAPSTVNAQFGIANIAHVVGSGIYNITINVVDPVTGNQKFLDDAAIVATLVAENDVFPCGSISVTRINANNQFKVCTRNASCVAVDMPFMFHLTGRYRP